MIDKGLAVKNVEVVKSETDPTSGLLQAPTIKTKEITPIASDTNVKILNFISNRITPSIGAASLLDGDTTISRDLAVRFGGNLMQIESKKRCPTEAA